jgi:hypothetical protein
MKIRIGDQSLRIRLSMEEARTLAKESIVTTSLCLNAMDNFEIELRPWHLEIGEVHTERNKLTASIPLTAARRLHEEKGYSFQCEQEVSGLPPLRLEVEIDLQKAQHS